MFGVYAISARGFFSEGFRAPESNPPKSSLMLSFDQWAGLGGELKVLRETSLGFL